MNTYQTIIDGMKRAKSFEEYNLWVAEYMKYLKEYRNANHN